MESPVVAGIVLLVIRVQALDLAEKSVTVSLLVVIIGSNTEAGVGEEAGEGTVLVECSLSSIVIFSNNCAVSR